MKKHIIIAITLLLLSEVAIGAEACAKKSSNGGVSSLKVKDSVGVNDFGDLHDDAWRDIAEELQESYDNNVAYDLPLVNIQAIHCIFGVCATLSYPLEYNGSNSIEKAVLDARDIDKDAQDPNPCDESKNESNGAPASGTGGGDGGGGGMYDGGYGGSIIWIPSPADPCANDRCIVTIKTG